MTGLRAKQRSQTARGLVTRTWHDLSSSQRDRVTRLLTPDPDDNLDDLAWRCERALQIIRGEKP